MTIGTTTTFVQVTTVKLWKVCGSSSRVACRHLTQVSEEGLRVRAMKEDPTATTYDEHNTSEAMLGRVINRLLSNI